MKYLQIKLNQSTMALQLIYATVADTDISILLVSELPQNSTTVTRWNLSLNNSFAIVLTSFANLVSSTTGSG